MSLLPNRIWLYGRIKKIECCMGTIMNDAKIINRENIARCCVSCNSSKGTKKLSHWLDSKYSKKRGISNDTVAEVVRQALDGLQ